MECYLGKRMLHACFSILLFMYKGKISRWSFKVVFLEMRILRIRQYVMWPTKCTATVICGACAKQIQRYNSSPSIRALARTCHACHFDIQLQFLTGEKLPFLTISCNFRPYWTGTLSKMMGNIKILAKALPSTRDRQNGGHCFCISVVKTRPDSPFKFLAYPARI